MEGKNNNKSLEISNKSSEDSQEIESYKNKVLSKKIISKSKKMINKNHLRKIQPLQEVFKSLQWKGKIELLLDYQLISSRYRTIIRVKNN